VSLNILGPILPEEREQLRRRTQKFIDFKPTSSQSFRVLFVDITLPVLTESIFLVHYK